MILSDIDIQKYIKEGKIKILPNFDPKNIRPVGIRVHLGDELLIPKPHQRVNLLEPIELQYETKNISDSEYIIKPGEFVLGSTYERIQVPNTIVGQLDGRSTIARVGLQIHCTSEIIDGNHEHPRCVVLEIRNIGNFEIVLTSRVPIGMLIFHQSTSPIKQRSQVQYQNQTGVQAPNLLVQLK